MNNKQSMELYTADQVRNAIAMGYDWCHQKHIPSDDIIDAFIEQLTPIELPSDEEISTIAMGLYGFNATSIKGVLEYKAFKRGAKWMRDKIQGGNK
jgi:hypothetical protein